MSGTSDAFAVLGIDRTIKADAVRRLRDEIADVWSHSVGPVGQLDNDLKALHKQFFNPVATGRTVRSALSSVREPQRVPTEASRLLIPVGPATFLPTPEARLVLELLKDAGDRDLEISDRAANGAVAKLAVLYRNWSRHRLDETLALVNGTGRPLQLMPIGGVLTLLVNRSDDPSRAIARFPKGSAEAERLDDAFFAPAAAFASTIHPRKPNTAPERLISGWTLSEVSVRVPAAIRISDSDGVFVEPSQRDAVIELVRRELTARELAHHAVSEAFDALVRELGEKAPVLAGFGLLFERPAATARLKQRLTTD